MDWVSISAKQTRTCRTPDPCRLDPVCPKNRPSFPDCKSIAVVSGAFAVRPKLKFLITITIFKNAVNEYCRTANAEDVFFKRGISHRVRDYRTDALKKGIQSTRPASRRAEIRKRSLIFLPRIKFRGRCWKTTLETRTTRSRNVSPRKYD